MGLLNYTDRMILPRLKLLQLRPLLSSQGRQHGSLCMIMDRNEKKKSPNSRFINSRVPCGPAPHSNGQRFVSSKIGSILKAGIGSTAFPIYRCGVGDGQGVGLLPFTYDDGQMLRGKRKSIDYLLYVGS